MNLTFDKDSGLYRDGDIPLPREAIRGEIDRILRYSSRQTKTISEQLVAKQITLADWQLSIQGVIRNGHILAAIIGFGGQEAMTAGRWKQVGRTLRYQYAYLNDFARQIEQRKVVFDSQVVRRADLYTKSIRATYYLGESATAEEAGFEFSRRVIHALEQCSGCKAWNAQGTVPIGQQPQIGTLRCGQFCRCTLEYS